MFIPFNSTHHVSKNMYFGSAKMSKGVNNLGVHEMELGTNIELN